MTFPLNGNIKTEWYEFLKEYDITHWHSSQQIQPIKYLGFPLYLNVSQRNNFIHELTEETSAACNIHSQRNLSIRGRTTVLNTLILSKLWYVLRLTPLTIKQLDKIKSIAQGFINRRIYPPIPYSTLIKRRSQGGIGLLDVRTQQHLLQDRWIEPLLVSSLQDHTVSTRYLTCPMAIQYLSKVCCNWFKVEDPILLVLFPKIRTRGSAMNSRLVSLSPLTNIFRAIDHLPRNFTIVLINAKTALTLPLIHIWFFHESSLLTTYPSLKSF
ncbi:hypothetical protein K501DRAFT_199320 [Backusella circina FSU 941]|nr:hypothetical protein K501DRAFT_199320 [Backusella circina FSU 941]